MPVGICPQHAPAPVSGSRTQFDASPHEATKSGSHAVPSTGGVAQRARPLPAARQVRAGQQSCASIQASPSPRGEAQSPLVASAVVRRHRSDASQGADASHASPARRHSTQRDWPRSQPSPAAQSSSTPAHAPPEAVATTQRPASRSHTFASAQSLCWTHSPPSPTSPLATQTGGGRPRSQSASGHPWCSHASPSTGMEMQTAGSSAQSIGSPQARAGVLAEPGLVHTAALPPPHVCPSGQSSSSAPQAPQASVERQSPEV